MPSLHRESTDCLILLQMSCMYESNFTNFLKYVRHWFMHIKVAQGVSGLMLGDFSLEAGMDLS